MPEPSAILSALQAAVIAGDAAEAARNAQAALDAGIEPLVAIEEGLTPGIREVGERFGRLEMFLPEMLLSAKAMEAALAIIEPHLGKIASMNKGTIVIGTVKGDIHDIGKNIAIALLKVNGYRVVDLGRDVPLTAFIDRANEEQAQIIGMSGLLTTSLPLMRDVIQMIDEEGMRDRFKIIIGGGPTSQEYANEIGADGYAEDAHLGVLLCDRLIGKA